LSALIDLRLLRADAGLTAYLRLLHAGTRLTSRVGLSAYLRLLRAGTELTSRVGLSALIDLRLLRADAGLTSRRRLAPAHSSLLSGNVRQSERGNSLCVDLATGLEALLALECY
jgi:hypothetical protein